MSLIGGSLLTFQFLLAFVLTRGWLTLLARRCVSRSGLLVGWILLTGPPRRPLVLPRMSGTSVGMSLGWFLRGVALGSAASTSSVDDFWSTWSRSAELGLFRAYSKAGGPTEAGSSAFLGRGLLRIRNRRLGGRAAGGKSSGRLYRVSHGDEVDVHCAQYFVNSSLVYLPASELAFEGLIWRTVGEYGDARLERCRAFLPVPGVMQTVQRAEFWGAIVALQAF